MDLNRVLACLVLWWHKHGINGWRDEGRYESLE